LSSQDPDQRSGTFVTASPEEQLGEKRPSLKPVEASRIRLVM
jgi:hypothetical protein